MTSRVYWSVTTSVVFFWLFSVSVVWANTGGIPSLSTPIQLVTQTIGGSVLASLLTLAFIVCGIGIAFAQTHGYERLGHLFVGGGVAIGAPTIVLALFAALGAANPLTLPASPSMTAMLAEDVVSLSVHTWFTYLGWRGVRYVQRVARGL